MYAIVEIAGKQYRVEKDQQLQVPFLNGDAGSKIEFDRVLLYNDDKGGVKIGQPTVDKMKVSATILEHGRGKKIIVFKKKRRKGYQVKNGHRQGFSLVKIDNIMAAKAAPKKATSEKAEKPVKSAAKKTEKTVKTEKPAPEKKAAKKTTKKAAPKTSEKSTTAKSTKTPAATAKKTTKPKSAEKAVKSEGKKED